MKLKDVKLNTEERCFDITMSMTHDEVADILYVINTMSEKANALNNDKVIP